MIAVAAMIAATTQRVSRAKPERSVKRSRANGTGTAAGMEGRLH